MTDTCYECGNEYERIATHWNNSDCDYQSLSDKQHDVITGLLMGDGWIHYSNKRPYLAVSMITKEYLEHLSNEIFPTCSGAVNLKNTAKEAAKARRETGFSPNSEASDCSDVYQWQTMAHPELHQYKEWYSSGEKVFPSDIELTPTVLEQWYVSDGCLNNGRYPGIALSNEYQNKKKIENMFERAGLSDFFWIERERPRGGSKPHTRIRFRAKGTKEFFKYVGSPPPGFSYKWL